MGILARRLRAVLTVCFCVCIASCARANSFVKLDFNLTLQAGSRDTVFIELFDDRPRTRDNFLAYVNGGVYDDSLMHRLAKNSVLQGGGYYPELLVEPAPLNVSLDPTAKVDLDGSPSTPNPTVNNEFSNTPFRSNVAGTLSMAKLGGNPDSATSEFFFNIGNNGGSSPNGLDFQNGGFTVFARVAGDGMTLINAFNGLAIANLNPDYDNNGTRDAGYPFFNNSTDGTPVLGGNLLLLQDAEQIDYLGAGSTTTVPADGLTFGTRDAFIDTGALFAGSGDLTIAPNRILGIREGFSLNRPLVNLGTLQPGQQLGAITLQSYRQDPGASLEIQLRTVDPAIPDAQEFDALNVTGVALLGGDLDVSLLGSFVPTAGNSFTVLKAAFITSAFNNVNLPTLNPGLAWLVDASSTAISLSVVAPDFSRDGIVNGVDLALWESSFGQSGTNLAADGNRDGVVDGNDYMIWQRTLGRNVGILAVTAVPEPRSLVLAAFAIGAFVSRRRIAALSRHPAPTKLGRG